MYKIGKLILGGIILLAALLQINPLLAYANTVSPSASGGVNAMPPVNPASSALMPNNASSSVAGSNAFSLLQNSGLNHWDLGPLSVGSTYDSLLGTIFNAQYIQKLSSNWAFGILSEYGSNQSRFNGTLGYQFTKDAQIKLTGEYLSQVLPFQFDSGDINKRVQQSAYGLEWRKNLNHPIFEDLNINAYWAKAPNEALGSQIFMIDDLYYTNMRNIAGATSKGVNVGTDMLLSLLTTVKMKLFYDSVLYDTEFSSSSTYNSSAGGALLELEQVLNPRLKFLIKAEKRAIYSIYGSELDWKPKFSRSLPIEFGLFVQHLVSSNQAPNSNSVGISLSLADGGPTLPDYTPTRSNAITDLVPWVKTPAVYMERVLAVSEQKITLNGPVIKNISPGSGPLVGGNTVTISGTNFLAGVSVTFNDVAAAVDLISSTSLSAIVPASSTEGAVQVRVLNSDGQTMTLSDGYTYLIMDAPTVTSISPTQGATAGGTPVTISGTNFTGTTAVNFGAVPASSFTINSPTSITATSPSNSAGVVDITVTSPDGTSATSSADQFTYYALPTVTGISPNNGSVTGGDSITISGTNFVGVTSVQFGDTDASFVVDSDTSITATSPAGSAGVIDITVTTPGGTSSTSSADQFTYYALPIVTGVSPSNGYTNVNTSVTISGGNFEGVTNVYFGSTAASSFTINDATSITATSPPGSAGVVDVTVTTPGGTSNISTADQFTYTDPPHIIFVTTAVSTGNLGGFSGADAKCNSSGNGKPTSGFAKDYIYKALLNGNNATTNGVTYYRTDGTTMIATAFGGNLVGSSSLNNAISTSTSQAWTGATGSNCSNWSSGSSGLGGSGTTSSATSSYWSPNNRSCALSTTHLYCVSQ